MIKIYIGNYYVLGLLYNSKSIDPKRKYGIVLTNLHLKSLRSDLTRSLLSLKNELVPTLGRFKNRLPVLGIAIHLEQNGIGD